MDRAEAKKLAKKELFRNGHTRFDDDLLNSWATQAMDWLETHRPDYWFWRTVFEQTVSQTADEFLPPEDFAVMISAWDLTNDKELTKLELDDLRSIFGSDFAEGRPEYFYEKGSRIVTGVDRAVFGLYRPLSDDVDLELVYYRRPIDFVDDTSLPDLPLQFHWFVKDFMVNRGAIFIEDDDLMRNSWALVQNIVKRIDKNHERRIKRRNWIAVRRSHRIIRTLRRRQGFFESRYP